jgi:phosphate-selective porin OprO/OprP
MAARLTGVPFMQDKTHLLHVGGGVWYRNLLGSSLSLSQRHGVFHVIDSKPWALSFGNEADSVFAYTLETVGIYGPAHFKAEYVDWNVDVESGSAFTDDVDLNGWSVEGGWFLTGESKNYSFKKAQFSSLKPKGIVGQGGIGAWEIGVRYDTLDLTDSDAGAIGGEGDLLTVGLNWYVNNTMRLMANYKRVLDFDCTGGTGDCLRLDGDESSAFLLRGQVYW